ALESVDDTHLAPILLGALRTHPAHVVPSGAPGRRRDPSAHPAPARTRFLVPHAGLRAHGRTWFYGRGRQPARFPGDSFPVGPGVKGSGGRGRGARPRGRVRGA